jgi:hypothetical protein
MLPPVLLTTHVISTVWGTMSRRLWSNESS